VWGLQGTGGNDWPVVLHHKRQQQTRSKKQRSRLWIRHRASVYQNWKAITFDSAWRYGFYLSLNHAVYFKFAHTSLVKVDSQHAQFYILLLCTCIYYEFCFIRVCLLLCIIKIEFVYQQSVCLRCIISEHVNMSCYYTVRSLVLFYSGVYIILFIL